MARTSASGNDDSARAGRFASRYMVDAGFAQLVGLCRGILADEELKDSEIVTLDQWLTAYADRLPEWPCQALAKRVREILSDGIVEDKERADLLEYLKNLTGESGGMNDAPTSLPLTDPPPFIEYVGNEFCLTGTFVFGPRRKVAAAIEEQGGRIIDQASRATYLVIGGTITPSWKFGTHGLKIEEGVAARNKKGRPDIVSEEHWVASLC